MNKKNLYNILDFGNSNIRFVTFDEDLKEKFSESIPIVLETENLNYFNEIKNVIKKAEKKTSSYIKDIILINNPKNLFEINLSLYRRLNDTSSINKIFKSLLLELNHLMNINYNHYDIAHIIIDKCIVSDKIYYKFPFQLNKIDNIKVDFKLICLPKKFNINIREEFNKINLNIRNFFCTPYTKTSYYLNKFNYENISFLEIGFNKTTITIYENNNLKVIYSIPIGSFNITKDISKIFKISIQEADQIKKLFSKSETEFSYDDTQKYNSRSTNIILNKNISINTLKKVILYRIQEIFDLTFTKSNISKYNLKLNNSNLFLIGEGSRLFNNNSFFLEDKFGYKSIKYYDENDVEICKSGLICYLNNIETPKFSTKKQGLFEKFFNFFSK